MAYKFALPPKSKIHPILRVSLVKPYHGPTPLATIVCDIAEHISMPLPEAIVLERTVMTLEGPQH